MSWCAEQWNILAIAVEASGAVILLRRPLLERVSSVRNRAQVGEAYLGSEADGRKGRILAARTFARGEQADTWTGVAAIGAGVAIHGWIALAASRAPWSLLLAGSCGILAVIGLRAGLGRLLLTIAKRQEPEDAS